MSTKNKKLEDLLGHQGRAKVAQSKADRISAAILEQQALLSGAGEVEARLSELSGRRNEIAAGLALGENTPADLAKIDQELKAVSEEALRMEGVRETLDGLRGKLHSANSELAGIVNREVHPAKISFLLAEAEELGVEYLAAVEQVVKLYRRLLALDSILRPFGYPVAYNLSQSDDIKIPRFMLTCHEPFSGGRQIYLAEAADLLGVSPDGRANADIAAERDRLTAMGVEL